MLTGLLVLGAAAVAAAQPPQKQVLVLQSSHRGSLVLDAFTTNFHVELDHLAEQPVNFVQFFVGPTGPGGASEQAVVDFIVSSFAGGPKPDLVVAIAGPASVFVRKHRSQLFPDTPLLLTSVDHRFLTGATFAENETAVAVNNDFPRLVDEILQVLPQTRQVVVITGPGQIGKFWRAELEKEFTRFRDRLTFQWFDDLALGEVLRRSASLPDHSAIIYLTFGTDASGAAYADQRVVASLHDTANAPLFNGHSVFLGTGVVGGSLIPIDDLSRRSADVAIGLLNGEPARSLAVPHQGPGSPIFDWRELQRWGIPESRLPSGSVVRYRGSSLWSEYRRTVLVAVGVLAFQSLLIGWLLYERRARRRAEVDSRRNLALAADASRRETMSALTGSIAHELGQPLGSMMYNAQALQMMVTGNHATADTIGEILSDIQAQGLRATQIIDRHRAMLRSRQMDKKPLDVHVVVRESLAFVARDLDERQIVVAVLLSSTPCVISGDQVLLEQVFVNLMINAMDAMGGTPLTERRLTISSDVRATEVELVIRDNGTGVRPDLIDTLFTPFTTTKSHGLGIGLTIARTILDAHGGSITARNNPDRGATFVVTLLRAETPTIQSAPPAA